MNMPMKPRDPTNPYQVIQDLSNRIMDLLLKGSKNQKRAVQNALERVHQKMDRRQIGGTHQECPTIRILGSKMKDGITPIPYSTVREVVKNLHDEILALEVARMSRTERASVTGGKKAIVSAHA